MSSTDAHTSFHCRTGLVQQFDLQRAFRSIDWELRVFKSRRAHAFARIIGSAVAFLRNSHEVLIELLVHILVVKNRNGISTFRNTGKSNLRAQGSWIDIGCLRADRLGCIAWKSFGAPE